jgi:hypothetical protein
VPGHRIGTALGDRCESLSKYAERVLPRGLDQLSLATDEWGTQAVGVVV